MKECIMTIGSQTHAQKAKKAIAKEKIESRIVKSESDDGCVFGLALDCRDFIRVAGIMRSEGIKFRRN